MIFVGVLFVIANYALSRLSRRLEVGQQRRTAGGGKVAAAGVEDLAVRT